MFHGKMKAVTFSYDDGITQDRRLIELFDRYGLKATFNLNSGRLGLANSLLRENVTVAHCVPRKEEIREIYQGHEVAAHTLTHPNLTKIPDADVVREVEEDRLALSEIVGYEVVGMAYPGGGVNFDDRVVELVRNQTGIRYARIAISSGDFEPQSDLLRFRPTVYHHKEFDKMFDLAEKFLELKPDTPKIFYIWGHAYEFDIHNTWGRMEDFCKLISGREDIFYGTNREVLLDEEA